MLYIKKSFPATTFSLRSAQPAIYQELSSAFSLRSAQPAIYQELSSAFSLRSAQPAIYQEAQPAIYQELSSALRASPLPVTAASSSSAFCASPLPETVASCAGMIRIQWERNGSKCYDGRTQDIPLHLILLEDQQREVGDSVRVEWQDGGRLWNAVVLEKLPQPSALDMALPATRLLATPREVSFALFCVACIFTHSFCLPSHQIHYCKEHFMHATSATLCYTCCILIVDIHAHIAIYIYQERIIKLCWKLLSN